MNLDFKTLWNAHPTNKGNNEPCSTNGVSNFDNQCAIRMGVCLTNAGISTASFSGARCYPGHGHNSVHILRAEELAKWMAMNTTPFGTVEKKNGVSSTDYADRKGIVFFLNFWGRGSQGDHIDLWDGKKMCYGDPSYFSRAQSVWFWEVNDVITQR